MKDFAIYENPQGSQQAVKRGWSWPAFFFSWIWALTKKLWLKAGIMFLATFILGFSSEPLAAIHELVFLFVSVGVYGFFGAKGNAWVEANLQSRGYDCKMLVEALNPEGALATYAKRAEQLTSAEKKAYSLLKDGADFAIVGFATPRTGFNAPQIEQFRNMYRNRMAAVLSFFEKQSTLSIYTSDKKDDWDRTAVDLNAVGCSILYSHDYDQHSLGIKLEFDTEKVDIFYFLVPLSISRSELLRKLAPLRRALGDAFVQDYKPPSSKEQMEVFTRLPEANEVAKIFSNNAADFALVGLVFAADTPMRRDVAVLAFESSTGCLVFEVFPEDGKRATTKVNLREGGRAMCAYVEGAEEAFHALMLRLEREDGAVWEFVFLVPKAVHQSKAEFLDAIGPFRRAIGEAFRETR